MLSRSKRHNAGLPSKGVIKKGFRPDIQGLRALAVLLVIADHLVGWPGGGFIGVDVFFVLSGFLITGLLIREHENHGRISFANFYRRRARRILPLSVLVLFVTIGVSWALFNTGRAIRVTEDGTWSLIFGMNWHLALSGTDYMQADGLVSPLQHFWSLAVEEQFYVVWPWIIVLILGVVASRLGLGKHLATKLLISVMALLSIISFAYALWETSFSPTFAYFSTFSRAWELGAGALLAAVAPTVNRIPDVVRPFMAYAGLAGIVLGALLITPDFPFPGPWAIVPVFSTLLVLAAGAGGKHRFLQPLTNPMARYLGDISFSLYLWHFPLIILIGSVTPLDSPAALLGVFAVTLGLSAASFYFLEEPLRTSQWLEPRSRRIDNSATRERLLHGALVALALVTATVSSAAFLRSMPASAAYDPPAMALNAQEETPSTPTVQLQRSVQLALDTGVWPKLSPSVDELGPESKATEWAQDGCLALDRRALADPVENAMRCVYGSLESEKTAVLIGDSMAISYLPGIRAALEPQGYKIMVFTMAQCAVPSLSVLKSDGAPHPDCGPFRDWAIDATNDLNPDMVILSSQVKPSVEGVNTDEDFLRETAAGYKVTFERLAHATDQLVVMSGPPGGKPLAECSTRVSVPSDCISTPGARFEIGTRAIQNAVESVKTTVGVEYIDTKRWFCSFDRCPPFVGNTPVYADGSHLTSSYSAGLAPVIAEAVIHD